MFTLSHTMPVNTEKPSLNQAQIWQGLLLKAENPVRCDERVHGH